MNEQQITRGLSALADEHVPRAVDVDKLVAIVRFRHRRRLAVAGAAASVTAIIAGLIVATGDAGPDIQPAATPGRWTLTEFAGFDPNGSTLSAVAAISDSDAWAAGTTVGTNNKAAGLAAHWDGQRWSRVDMPGDAGLADLAAIAADDVWAVGTAVGAGGFTAHWDGRMWTEVPSPVPGGVPADWFVTLDGIAALSATDVWAVGCAGDNNVNGLEPRFPVIQRWDGRQWRLSAVPDLPTGRQTCLRDVVAVADNDVWAVGSAAAGVKDSTPLILHWDGRQWSIVEPARPVSPTQVGSFTELVALSANDVWAFGGWAGEFAQRWDGRQWRRAESPKGTQPGFSTTAPDGRDGLLVSVGSGSDLNKTFRWDGKTWTMVAGPVPAEPPGTLITAIGVARGSNVLWAVGNNFHSPTKPAFAAFTSLSPMRRGKP